MKKLNLLLILLILVGCSGERTLKTTPSNIFKHGSINGNIYTNESLNFKFEPTDNIVMLAEEELISFYQEDYDSLPENTNSLNDIDLDSLPILHELVASILKSPSGVRIAAHKKPDFQISSVEYLNSVVDAFNEIDGYEIIFKNDVIDYDLCGTKYASISCLLGFQEYAINYMFLYKEFDDRVVILTFGYLNELDLDEILACFSKLK